MSRDTIRIKGARQHNLKNLSLDIPKNQLVVITGVSGSGKSSLAFKTLYAEGQRRYVESLSAYARQFLERLDKPDVDFIEGLSPAIAIEQRTAAATPRSTIATVTEIYDYLRILYASVGQAHDPTTGDPIFRKSIQTLCEELLTLPERTRVVVLAPLLVDARSRLADITARFQREGFVRIRIDGVIYELEGDFTKKKFPKPPKAIEAVVDRLAIREGIMTRLNDSIETALKWGRQRVFFLVSDDQEHWTLRRETTAYANPKTGFTLEALTPRHFSFNSHLGACESCQGLGVRSFVDPDLFIASPDKPLLEGGLRSWWGSQKKMKDLQFERLRRFAEEEGVDLSTPVQSLPASFMTALFQGDEAKGQEGLLAEATRLLNESESQKLQQNLRSFTSEQTCADCKGRRLKPEILAVTLTDEMGQECSISSFTELSIRDALKWIGQLHLSDHQKSFVSEVHREILKRLSFLDQVGLGYLALDRESRSLSGGESQRIRLATQIGAGLSGVLYVLDEPSIGLHQRDNARLLETLKELRDLGNSVIVVEHDEETMMAADYLIDMGPGAGPLGGEIIASGTPEEVRSNPDSPTGKYLNAQYAIKIPSKRNPAKGWLRVRGCSEHNLKGIDVDFPLGCFVCVTGVSGSGKSTLVDSILKRILFRHFHRSPLKPGRYEDIQGLDRIDKAIVIDQSPIGRSPRSNPATYVSAFTAIRELFANLPAARIRGYGATRFSFNRPGGRCEHCKGDGSIRIDMHFLSDVYVTCDVCHGTRYNRETLEVTFKGKTIAEVLDLNVGQATQFFRSVPTIAEKLGALEKVGLGYLKLGQGGTTLSGGEAQRVKLAAELARKATGRTLYLLDEPTTGLHFADVETLLRVFSSLREAGNSLIVIEHNLDVIKSADWVIDLGPEGGDGGGQVVASGTPEEIAANPSSHTGHYLKIALKRSIRKQPVGS